MELSKQFIQNISEQGWFSTPKVAVLAVSTGVDSMTLLDLFLKAKISGLKLVVAYVDHQLRPESAKESEFIRQFCQEHDLELRTKIWKNQFHPQSGIEEAARNFRYEFFAEVMKDVSADYLVTAHHANDLAETVIMKIIRGGWLESAIGIPAERLFAGGKLIRPLLGMTKADIRDYATQIGLKWFEDQSNYTDENLRNRIRHEIIPKLQEENSAAVEHIASFSHQLTELLAVSDEFVEQQLAGMSVHSDEEHILDIDNHDRLSYPLLKLILKRWLSDGIPAVGISNDSVDQIIALINNQERPQGEVVLADNVIVKKRYSKLILQSLPENPKFHSQKSSGFMVTLDRWYQINESQRFGVFKELPNQVTGKVSEIRLRKSDLPLYCRNTESGDRFELENGGHQKVSRLLINQKLPVESRAMVQVVTTSTNRILAILGLRVVKTNRDGGSNIYYLIEN